jgi:hypothetical protein
MTKKPNGSEGEGSKKAVEGKRPLTHLDPMHDDMYLSKNRQCSAMSKIHGRQCHNRAMVGQRTCRMHGGASKQAKAKAAERIHAAQNEAADLLVEFMADPDTPRDLRTKIAQDLLNRAGVSEKHVFQIGVEQPKTFEDWVGEAMVDVVISDDPNVIDAEVIEDDPTPVMPRDPNVIDAGNRHDRAVFAEVERSRAIQPRPGAMSESERARVEAEALGLAPRQERRGGGRSDDERAMAEQQDREDAVLQRVKDAERRRNEERRKNRRARTSEATISQPQRRGERR